MTGPQQMVVVFCFSPGWRHVLLVRKNRPDWQRGKLNGPGGKVEPGETPLQAAVRELFEETGVAVAPECLRRVLVMKSEHGLYEVTFYAAYDIDLDKVLQTTDEAPVFVPLTVYGCPVGAPPLIPNLYWILPMALDRVTLEGTITCTP